MEEIKRAVITDDFSASVSACAEELLPSGHLGIAFELADTSLADDISASLSAGKFKVSRFSFADGTPPSHEATEEIIRASEDMRLIICAGGADMADIVKYAAKKRGVPWILSPSSPDILPAAESTATLGWGALAERVEASSPSAIVADRRRMENCTGREKAAAYGSLAAQRLYCAELECEHLIFGRETGCTQELSDICAGALMSGAEGLAENSLKAAIEKQKRRITGRGSAEWLARILSAVSDDGRSVSENCFICARVLTRIYSAVLSYKGADVCIPPDRAECAAALGKLCGGDKTGLISRLKTGADFERVAYVIGEYRTDLLNLLNNLQENEGIYARTFRRMYEDAGFWLGKYVRPSDLMYLASLAIAVMPADTLAGAVSATGLACL